MKDYQLRMKGDVCLDNVHLIWGVVMVLWVSIVCLFIFWNLFIESKVNSQIWAGVHGWGFEVRDNL